MTSSTTFACPFCRIALTPPETVCPRDGHAAVAVDWVDVPAALSKRFRVLEPFAHGGTGSLYLADESESGRRGLLKILGSVAKHREPERARLRRELSKQITLAGGRLAVPWASGETDGVTWLFRPWLDGISLRVRLSQASAMGVEEALAIASQLAVGLDELHRAGLLHRDIKPSHVFLQTNGQGVAKALLIDPGLCGALVRPGNSTVLGTPGYVAPEQLQGKLVSFRSDLYSLGCVMYEILSGRPPFGGENEQAVLTAQLTGEAPPLPADLPQGIVAVLRSLLSKEPQERPFSAQKLRRILEPYAPDGTPMTRPPTTTFGTLPDPEKPAAKPAPGPSLPPPPPSEALRASKAPSEAPRVSKAPSAPSEAPRASKAPSAPSEAPRASKPSKAPPAPAEALRASRMMPAAARPVGRPTTRGLAPPPPPRVSAEETQQIDLESFELIAEQDEQGADSTQELSPAHLFDVHVHEEPKAAAAKAVRDDLTVPVRLDQILAIAPARLRASAPPVHREPVRSEAAASVDEQPTMFVEDEHETLPFSGHDGALPAPSSALFGAMAPEASAFAVGPSSDEDGDAEKTTVHKPSSPYISERPTPFAHIVANDDDLSPALAAPSGLAPHTIDDNNEEADLASRHLQDTLLHPYGLGGSRRKLVLGATAAALLILGIVTVKALVGGGEEKIAAREVPQPPSPPAAVVVQAAEPSVEPTPSVTALAAAPKGETAKPEAQPTAAEPTTEAAQGPAAVEAPGAATLTPTPIVEAMADKKEAVVEAKPDERAEEPVVAKAQPAKSPEASARPSQEDQRRQRREEKARAAAEKEAKAAAAKSAKAAEKQSKQAKKASSASSDRTAKWNAAVEEARQHYAAKRYKQAAQAYEKATQLDPTSDRTFSGLGTARFKATDYKGAAAAYLRAVQLSPSNSVYHTSLARTYQQLGDLTKAKASYKRAVALDPKNEGAKKSLKDLGG